MLVISAKEKNIEWDVENLECNVGGKAEHGITESGLRLTSEKVGLGGGEEVCQTAIWGTRFQADGKQQQSLERQDGESQGSPCDQNGMSKRKSRRR